MIKSHIKTTLKGSLEHITYYNPENHYTIAKFRLEKTRNRIMVRGFMPVPNLGEVLKITGTWETHPKYGEQFKIGSFEVILPATVEGIRKYLESGFVKGIGPKMAARLIDYFEERTLEIIEKEPARLIEVTGIGKTKALSISSAWTEHQAMRHIIKLLQEVGLKTSYSAKIFKEYGPNAVNILFEDPYRLVNDFPRIGFFMADAIIQKSGVSVNASERTKACVMHLLQQSSDEGHIFIYEYQIVDRCKKYFHIDPNATRDAIEELVETGHVKIEQDLHTTGSSVIFLKSLHEAETGIANRIKAILSVRVPVPDIDPEQMTQEVLKKLAIKLSDEQIKVLEGILSHRVAIVTGGPGTGKTTLIRSIHTILELLGKKILLGAPTGRAARHLAEVTHRKAATIHKLLGYNLTEGRFLKNQDDPLDLDALIIDEASMVDTFLMFRLLNAIPVKSMLILVGDIFQLPSVGPGNVLSDLIESKKIKTFELKKIFRQSQESTIVVNAHRVRRGEQPNISELDVSLGRSEFYFIEKDRPAEVVETIVELCSEKVPYRFDLDPIDGIQVLTPMHRGDVGTHNLNQVLQKVLNPQSSATELDGTRFRLRDKVMHLRNNYQKEVFNGEIGRIIAIDKTDRRLSVDYDDRIIHYDFSELDELTLAYAISVHKSQGSEYPAVIIPVMTQHFALLQRNLLYTAMTRGKKLVILVGMKQALDIALKNDTPRRRNSRLAARLI
jgi:exodeoxyribonuclease V alpha subunit